MLRIGTCSWKYDSWEGLLYSSKKGINFLKEYSEVYNTVEIDQWFWSLHGGSVLLPQRSVAEEYDNSTPENFKFTIKVPNSITLTHHYAKQKGESLTANANFLRPELFHAFFDSISPIHHKVGLLMLQFEYLNKLKMSSQQELLEKLNLFLESINPEIKRLIALEIRNPNYLNKPFFEFLSANKLSVVFLEGYYMPPVWETFNRFKELISLPVVIRLHGPDRKGIEESSKGVWNKIIEPKDELLKQVSYMIDYFSKLNTDVYVNVNNHFEGSAPLTIERLKSQLSSLTA